jgi:4-diphosphocytidyl-2-C-methyl-D-erythritol kinase
LKSEGLAPAKVNLFLHVGPVQPDGYHPVASWMVFADIGDRLTLEPASQWSFATTGEWATAIGGGENLVERAARLLFEGAEAPARPSCLTLHKHLPVAAGLGGGSSDAAAALRLLNAGLPKLLSGAELDAVAARLGADGPACLHARSVLATGVGDRLAPAPRSPPLPAVLVNPRRPSPTGAVYGEYDAGAVRAADAPDLPGGFSSPGEVAHALATCRNDLEAPAVRLEPAIAEVLRDLEAAPETLLARMSGSGATCFALCADAADANRLATRLQADRPGWWVKACTLCPEADTGFTKT